MSERLPVQSVDGANEGAVKAFWAVSRKTGDDPKNMGRSGKIHHRSFPGVVRREGRLLVVSAFWSDSSLQPQQQRGGKGKRLPHRPTYHIGSTVPAPCAPACHRPPALCPNRPSGPSRPPGQSVSARNAHMHRKVEVASAPLST
jgi:hypothetical protein